MKQPYCQHRTSYSSVPGCLDRSPRPAVSIAQQKMNGPSNTMIGDHKGSSCGNGPNNSNRYTLKTSLLSVCPFARLAARPGIGPEPLDDGEKV